MVLDLLNARFSGYSDEEILEFLRSKYSDFNFDEAIEAGYSDKDIIEYLSSWQSLVKKSPKLFKGEDGQPGLTGAKGKDGTDGGRGFRGFKGKDGLDGKQGVKGDKGDVGPQGLRGTKGDKGDTGEQGPKGEPGHIVYADTPVDNGNPNEKGLWTLGGGSKFKLTSKGTGTSIIKAAKPRAAELKSLAAGTGITITDNGTGTLTLASTSSGGGTWGSITGTLSNQTDLQTALNAKLSSVTTGATLTGAGTSGSPLIIVNPNPHPKWFSSTQLILDLNTVAFAETNIFTGANGDAPNQAMWTLPPAATFGQGTMTFKHYGLGSSSPNSYNFFVTARGSEKLDNTAGGSRTMAVNRGFMLGCDGTQWFTLFIYYPSFLT